MIQYYNTVGLQSCMQNLILDADTLGKEVLLLLPSGDQIDNVLPAAAMGALW